MPARIGGLASSLLAVLLAGCAAVAVPPTAVPRAAALHQPADRPSPAAADAGIAVGTPARDWWLALGDPRLDALVARAVERSPDLGGAIAAVRAARAAVDAAEREALPQGGLGAQRQSRRLAAADADLYRQGLGRPPTVGLVTMTQALAWELDLFGRIGTAAAVTERRADAAAADLHAARAMLQAEVVRQYVRLRHQQREQSLLAEETATLEARAARMRTRADAGLADTREALAAAAEHARAEAERARARGAAATHRAALAVLLGRSPAVVDAELDTLLAPGPLPELPPIGSIVHPTDLLSRRPDVARADALLRAALGEATLAERAHLPRLTLNLGIGLNATPGSLLKADALRYAVGPTLQWDWLDAGRLRAREQAARAGSDAAWHAFERTVLAALQDSESSLRQWTAALDALARVERTDALAEEVATHARLRAAAGLEPSVASLESAASRTRAARTLAQARADSLLAWSQVQLALGAWQP